MGFAGDLARMTEATPGFVRPNNVPSKPVFDGISREQPFGLINHGSSKPQSGEPAGFGMEAKGIPGVVNPAPISRSTHADRSHQHNGRRRRRSPVNHEAKRSTKKPPFEAQVQAHFSDLSGRTLRPRVTSITSHSKTNCEHMTLLLIISTMFSAEEQLCANAVNLGSGMRPLPRNRREAESNPYAAQWTEAMADELENLRVRDVRLPLQKIPDYVRRVLGTTWVWKWK